MRDKQFRLVLTEDEHAMLFQLAEERQHPAAFVIRDLVRQEHRRVFGAATKAKAPAKRKARTR